jgi:hypothetical protein
MSVPGVQRYAGAVIEWGKVPWTLWGYALITVGSVVQFLLRVPYTHPVLIVMFVALMVAWTVFLLKGVRWLWIATLIAFGLGFLQIVIFGPRIWWSLLLSLIPLALLLAPPTRLYFAKQERQAHAATP